MTMDLLASISSTSGAFLYRPILLILMPLLDVTGIKKHMLEIPSLKYATGIAMLAAVLSATATAADQSVPQPSRTLPQAYSVERDAAAGTLTLRTPFYLIQQDMNRGGAIVRIALTHGKAPNLLVQPLEIFVQDERGAPLSDLKDPRPVVTHRREGLNEIVTVESTLCDVSGKPSPLRVNTTLQYLWGYIKIRREITSPPGFRVRVLCPLAMTVAPSLSYYGYRDGRMEEDGVPPFAFGSNTWGRIVPGAAKGPAVQTAHVPRSMILADPRVEGLEWFVGSDLAQWDLQLTGRRGQGQCLLQPSLDPQGLRLSVAPLASPDAPVALPARCAFDFYIAFPIRDGRAHEA
jgi:hypothetical protein